VDGGRWKIRGKPIAGCSHVNDVLKIRFPHPCRWIFVVVCAWWMWMTDIKGSFVCRMCMYVCMYVCIRRCDVVYGSCVTVGISYVF
jgi:hypothetical protein